MLLTSYRIEIFRPKCNPNFRSLHCFAYLDQDISRALPYLNTRLGAFEYVNDPSALTLRAHGKLITLHSNRIAINALWDESEAVKILEWLKREINETWEKRLEITPSHGRAPRPKVLDVLRILPKTNCKECGQPTCTVFSSLVVQGAKGVDDCPALDTAGRARLRRYLGQFHFDF
jgi:ArsR family metal-binding transcriptional regulator